MVSFNKVEIMKSFNEWLNKSKHNQFFSEGKISFNYDRNTFARLPWNWNSMIGYKIVQPLFYYAKENYVDGKPEVMNDDEVSIITLPNLQSIKDKTELSAKNIHTGNLPNLNSFILFLRNPEAWYDQKIDQIYEGIKMIGKKPEDFGGKDIRPLH